MNTIMKNARLMKKLMLIIGVFLGGCTLFHEPIDYMENSELYHYYFYFSKQGVLKKTSDELNRLTLYNTCLRQIDVIDNVANNLPYEIGNWTNDSVELCLYFDKSEWIYYKQAYDRLKNEERYIGNYRLWYSYKLVKSEGGFLLSPDTVDRVIMDNKNFNIKLFKCDKTLQNLQIRELDFYNAKIGYSFFDGKYSQTKEIILTKNLTIKGLLDYMFLTYKQGYCK